MTHPIATISLGNGKKIICELYPEEAPNTVCSFIHLAQKGCFDAHTVERLVPDYVADMSFRAFSKDYAKYLIPYEAMAKGFPNHLRLDFGMIGMGGYDEGIAGGEFFFPLKADPRLEQNYPAFGKVIEGLEEIARWNTIPVKDLSIDLYPGVRFSAPTEDIVIETVTVETFGESYGEPEKITQFPLPETWK